MLFFTSPLKRGINLIQNKKYDEAYKLLSALAEKKIKPAESHFYLGLCCFETEDFEKAKAHLHLALDLKPSENRISEILELTNWNMISSWKHFAANYVFSPDGKRLAYVCAKQDTNNDGKINSLDYAGIYLYDLAAGTEECVVKPEYVNTRLSFSPDGRSLTYISHRPKGPHGPIRPTLCFVDLETRVESELLKDFNVKYAAFCPDGVKIYFSGWKESDKNNGIYSYNLETGAIETVVPGIYESTFPSVSPKGDYLLFASWREDTSGNGKVDIHDNSGIYIKNLASGEEKELVSSKYNNTFPVFSNDGSKVMYLSVHRDNSGYSEAGSIANAGIYLLDLKKGREKCLVDDTFYNKFPVFTADGKNIVFITAGCHFRITRTRNDYFGYKGVYKLNLGRNEFSRIMSEKYYGSRAPVTAPGGTKVAYTSWKKGSNRGLYMADTEKLPEKAELHAWIDKNL